MFPTYSAEQQAQYEFTKLRGRASRHQVMNSLRGKSTHLMTLDEVLEEHEHVIQHDAGIQLVALDEIVGTVGRTYDFDDDFNPKRDNSRTRWCAVATAIYKGKTMPVIDLYQLADDYFVIDGNHRVSVMKSLGQEYIEAHVIKIENSMALRCQTQEIPVPRYER